MDIYDLLVYEVQRPIRITRKICFLKIMGCPFWEERRVNGEGHGEG